MRVLLFYVRAKEIESWQDEWTAPEKQNRVNRWSAKCPHCGEATVIGSSTGLLIAPNTYPSNHFLASERGKR